MRNFLLLIAFLFTVGCTSGPSSINAPGWIETTTPTGSTMKMRQPENPKSAGFIKVTETRDGVSLEGATGEAFENKNAEISAKFAAFKPYHIAAIGCIIAGGVILGTGYLPNRWGITLCGLGVALVILATLLPNYAHLVLYIGTAGSLAGAGYWLYLRPTPEAKPKQQILGI